MGRIDAKDKEILELLEENMRMSCSEIGRRIGLSHTAVAKRLERLKEKGVTAGVRREERRTANQYTFMVTVRTKKGCAIEVLDSLERERWASQKFTTGDSDVVILTYLNEYCVYQMMRALKQGDDRIDSYTYSPIGEYRTSIYA